MKTPTRNNHGFTLVELLVVIVIIAVLATVGFVMATRMKKSANRAVTTANMRQLGIGMLAHTSDTGFFPSQPGNGNGTWDREILPFLGLAEPIKGELTRSEFPEIADAVKVFAAPDDTIQRTEPDAYKRSFSVAAWTMNHSAKEGNPGAFSKNLPASKGIPYAVLSSPETAVMMFQTYVASNLMGAIPNNVQGIGKPEEILGSTHQVVFADGHIEAIPFSMPRAEFNKKYIPEP